MKIILRQENKYVLRFDKGEEVLGELNNFYKAKKIAAGFFWGLGAAKEVNLSFYDIDKKVYYDKLLKQKLEIISLLGNVAKMKKEIIIHAHGIFSDPKMRCWAGHIKKLVVSATAEIYLQVLKGKIERRYSHEIGLNLMK